MSSWNYFNQPFEQFPLKNFNHSKWGVSVQSWFWQSIQDVLNGTSFRNSETAMPYEVMQAFVANALRENADVIQFEPPWYFFNTPSESWQLRNTGTSTALYEQQPDYSKRFALGKIIETLLDPSSQPTMEQIFDNNQQCFVENDFDNPPNNFKKVVLASQNFSKVKYNYSTDYKNDVVMRDYILQNAKHATRIDINGDGQDEIAVLKSNYIYIYSNTNCLLKTISVPNAIGVTSANLIQSIVDGGDTDELIVIYGQNDYKTVVIYELYGYLNGFLEPDFRILSSAETLSILNQVNVPQNFFWIQGKRNLDVRYINNGTRPLDEMIVVLHQDNTDISAFGVPMCATIDYNLDGKDELAKSINGKIVIYDGNNVLNSTDFQPSGLLLSLKSSMPLNKIGVSSTEMWYRGVVSNNFVLKAKMDKSFNNSSSPATAIDNNEQTYAQAASNELWNLTVDLGSIQTNKKMYLSKGSINYVSKFRIDVSNDGQNWSTIINETSGTGGYKTYSFTSTSFRYAKLVATEAVGTSAHAIREIRFYNY